MGISKNPDVVMRNRNLVILSEAKNLLFTERKKRILRPQRPQNDNLLQVT